MTKPFQIPLARIVLLVEYLGECRGHFKSRHFIANAKFCFSGVKVANGGIHTGERAHTDAHVIPGACLHFSRTLVGETVPVSLDCLTPPLFYIVGVAKELSHCPWREGWHQLELPILHWPHSSLIAPHGTYTVQLVVFFKCICVWLPVLMTCNIHD